VLDTAKNAVILSEGWARTLRQPQSKDPDEFHLADAAQTFLPRAFRLLRHGYGFVGKKVRAAVWM
jgi:hypothetical protein